MPVTRSEHARLLTHALRRPHDESAYLDVDTTQSIRGRFFTRVRESIDSEVTYWNRDQRGELTLALRAISARVDDIQVVLLSKDDRTIGASIVPVVDILDNPWEVWDITGEDLCIVTQDIESGMCLEHSYYGLHGIYVPDGLFELCSWGKLEVQ
ncbi:MAG: hypothetical protein IPK69_08505 [Phycisphaerales bacterium]|nr:MAG: hypothetical protein IPK69_08505 [Phycisphaerales bacterium]